MKIGEPFRKLHFLTIDRYCILYHIDQRDEALQKLGELLNINYTENPGGTVTVPPVARRMSA